MARHVPILVAAGLTLVALWPLLAPGFVLTYDMVFVPKLRFTAELFGLGPGVSRSVPNELLVAVLSRILTGEVVQKLILLGSFLGAAVGASRLVPSDLRAAAAAAGVFYAWNATTYERLVMGHWTLLISLAALPWAVRAASDFRWGRPGSIPRLVGALAIASFGSPYGGLIATGVGLCVVAAPPWNGRARASGRAAAAVLGSALVLNLPWLLPSLLRPGGVPVRPPGLSAFAAGSDSPLGAAGSLLTLGGIWNGDVIPPGRSTWAWVPAFALLLVVAGAGWRWGRHRWPRGVVVGLAAAAGLGFVLALAPSVPGLRDGFRFLFENAPGGGLLRDSQKFVAPLALFEAIGFGMGVDRILAVGLERRLARAAAGMLVVAPLAVLPALAWGAAGRLGTARYPADWARSREIMADDDSRGAMLVLPWHLYVAFSWNADRSVLQPAQRYFTRRAVVNDDLELASVTVPGEDPWADLADPVVRSGEPFGPHLRDLGVRYILVEKIGDWRTILARTAGLDLVLDGPDLSLYRAPPPRPVGFVAAPAGPVIASDLAAAFLALWALGTRMLASNMLALLSFGRRRKGRTR